MYSIFNVPRLFIDYETPQTLEQLAWVLSSSTPGHRRLATDNDYGLRAFGKLRIGLKRWLHG